MGGVEFAFSHYRAGRPRIPRETLPSAFILKHFKTTLPKIMAGLLSCKSTSFLLFAETGKQKLRVHQRWWRLPSLAIKMLSLSTMCAAVILRTLLLGLNTGRYILYMDGPADLLIFTSPLNTQKGKSCKMDVRSCVMQKPTWIRFMCRSVLPLSISTKQKHLPDEDMRRLLLPSTILENVEEDVGVYYGSIWDLFLLSIGSR